MGILWAIWKGLKLFVWFCIDNWKVVLPIVLVILVLIFGLKWWQRRTVKLNEKQIQAAKEAIEQHNDEKLKEVFAKADADQAVIDGTVANAEAETKKVEAEAKKKYDAMTPDELAAELEARK